MAGQDDLTPDEKRALELILSKDGMLQSELWKALAADSRKGSRLAKSLTEKDYIRREETVTDGRTTYFLAPTNRSETVAAESESQRDTESTDTEGRDTELTEQEKQALSLIKSNGGIYQSEFWKELEVSSRKGSRIASSLEENDLIQREEAVYNGHNTYLLKPPKKDLDFSLLMAGDQISPLIGSEDDPDVIHSDEFTQWLVNLASEHD